MRTIPITQIVTRNCGGCGAWLDNPLSSPSPGPDLWPGFQLGGGGGNRFKNVKVKTLRGRTRRTGRTRRLKIKIKKYKKHRNTKKYK